MEDGNPNPNNAIISRETIDSVAGWVSATVSSAFFSSLERFSCVNVATTDADEDDDDDEAAHRPLALTDLTHPDQQHHHANDVAQLPV
ncbi:hypothetical protein RchiOBHm_Chr7g0186341 [Rosa chinensis]|uniref:Uncharacterized protein n=1 Tax=Rosa chinensis TaxID=74649 RepID=A0A2P6P3Z5_ROSCH|nr:uncharacterized protein LOC112175116 [Rosa chinensis]PRQ16632.1 hypothetical protein RchiOBHm_Chr7g0186341 [Rosa chinensis]